MRRLALLVLTLATAAGTDGPSYQNPPDTVPVPGGF
jgi:hypothetical protein